jgi:hypothetical protein
MLTVPKDDVENFNFSLPADVAAEFRRIGDVHGERNKLRWAVATAAVLKLLEMPEGEMHALIRQIAGARHYPETLSEMIEAAKRGSVPAPKPIAPFDAVAASIRSAPEHAPAPRKRRGDRRG